MAILNVTPDSFSDGGTFISPANALAAARNLAEPLRHRPSPISLMPRTADLLDVGAESTRPGSQPVPAAEQIARLLPVIAALVAEGFPIPLTVDTTSVDVAEATLAAGAAAINDISGGLFDLRILDVVARHNAGYIAMHIQGTPATMQVAPHYDDVVAEVISHLRARLAAARAAGIRPDRLVADPGIGFGKTLDHNLALLRALPRIRAELGVPLLVGASRKGFLARLTRDPSQSLSSDLAADRLAATAATTAWAAAEGADILRVHDVAETCDIVRVIHALSAH